MYYDMCLPDAGADAFVQRDRLAMAWQLGYDGAAIVREASKIISTEERCTLQQVPADVLLAAKGVSRLAPRTKLGLQQDKGPIKLRQLTRLTVAVDSAPDAAAAFAPGSSNCASYDILAVQPLSERVLSQACQSLEVDIITFDLSRRLPFKLKSGDLAAALKRNVAFEVCYAAALREDSTRQQADVLYPQARKRISLGPAKFLCLAALCRATRGKGIIISSGARQAFELRSPHDVINLASLFGLSEQHAREAVAGRCEAVLAHARRRRAYKGVLTLTKTPSHANGGADDVQQGMDNMETDEVKAGAMKESRKRKQ